MNTQPDPSRAEIQPSAAVDMSFASATGSPAPSGRLATAGAASAAEAIAFGPVQGETPESPEAGPPHATGEEDPNVRRTGTRVLLVDDDSKIVSLLERGLAFEGFDVMTSADGADGLEAAERHQPHVVLLDVAMPGSDGFEVCRRFRLTSNAPVIMLSARDEVSDKVRALNIGADDYVAKPFAFDELVARIRAVLRRHQDGEETLEHDDLVVKPATREAIRDGHPIELTSREFDLLVFFVRHPRQVLTRDQVLETVWGYATPVDTNVVEVHVGHLRQKLEAFGGRRLIHTFRGIGYALR